MRWLSLSGIGHQPTTVKYSGISDIGAFSAFSAFSETRHNHSRHLALKKWSPVLQILQSFGPPVVSLGSWVAGNRCVGELWELCVYSCQRILTAIARLCIQCIGKTLNLWNRLAFSLQSIIIRPSNNGRALAMNCMNSGDDSRHEI